MAAIALHLDHRPAETPLVLLPPFPFDARFWDAVRALLTDLPVVVADPPGFGDSAAPAELAQSVGEEETPALTIYARGIAAALDELGVERIVLAGLSIGGYSAMAFAELFPQRLAGIGLLDTAAEEDPEQKKADRREMADTVESGEDPGEILLESLPNMVSAATLEEREDVTSTLKGWYAEAPAAGVIWSQRAMANRPGRLQVLRGLDIPALVVRGAEDAVSSAESAEAMASALGTNVVEIPDAGHLSGVEAPGAVAAALRDLWERAVR
ncbi:MAG: alpha/beta hydrolase [bacterium]|nr:alpha/beta hydrolase [bacterium]